jgi:hypothetical protein
MKTLKELTALAKIEARRNDDVLLSPRGVREGELLFSAKPIGCQPGDAIGLPYIYLADVNTGRTRRCTTDESEMLSEGTFYDELDPIPE